MYSDFFDVRFVLEIVPLQGLLPKIYHYYFPEL